MDNINMTDEQYKMLYNRIRTDLYNEFINPKTATYGLDVVRQEDHKHMTEQELINEEIDNLTEVMKDYEHNEEYEDAALIKERIKNLKNKL
jgi:protein-arginine kinase activator protein McsA|tara:strand:- start:311 stop:583 length:273 start_codon:yes stop_codon:yes gene_type:complete